MTPARFLSTLQEAKPAHYLQRFSTKDEALEHMRMKNRTVVGDKDVFAVVDGPEDDFAVVDLATAIDLGMGYEWEAKPGTTRRERFAPRN